PMFRRVVMQPTFQPTAGQVQEVRFALQTTGWKLGLFWANVFQSNSAAFTLEIHGASGITLNDVVSVGFWPTLGSAGVGASAIGAFKTGGISPLPDFCRWVLVSNSNVVSMEIIAYLWDV